HSTAPILFLGPTGSGKSQLAKQVYELRKKIGTVRGSFVSVNCATLHGDLAYSTLFGHIKGSFTGAATNRNGLLKTADDGILFLDEIGELSLELQAQLLKAIEEKSYLPMGADQEIRSDFQLICATNKILPENISQGLFRQDLYARINLWEFHLPSLTERLEDIEPNIEYEIRRLRKEKGLLADFTPEAKKAYLDFATSEEALWTDNFRSLTASMERMVTYSSYGSITLEIVLQEIELLKKNWSKRTPPFQHAAAAFQTAEKTERFPLQNKLAAMQKTVHASQRDLFDAVQLEEVLSVCRNAKTRSEAGRKLFSASRQKKKSNDDTARLNKYLKGLNLTWEDIRLL
ncbi:MAG: sigma 54-interacting transcriptional regulator, partial [Mailhella sp.]|nr:sigma 54-interacting transcriptional regulator [Mailhella sp.]